MFDAKSVLGALLGGAQQQQGGIGAVLGGLLNQAQAGGQQGGGIGDILGKLAGGAGAQQGGGGLGDLLGKIAGGAGAAAGAGGGLAGTLGGLLNQATGGLRDAANHAGAAAGQPNAVNDILAKLGGGQGGDIVGKLRQMIEENPGMATAGLGGLASVVLGTGTGRNLAATAAKLGGLALIGGLAYSAWQNMQAGTDPQQSAQQQIAAAPAGSGFEEEAATNETAALFIRAMIAAAAADGQIDAAEKALILGSLQQAGFDAEANDWLENEMANPASIDDLVAAADGSQEVASQVYTAARLAIHPDKRSEQKFLLDLSSALELPDEVVAHIDASTDAAQAAA